MNTSMNMSVKKGTLGYIKFSHLITFLLMGMMTPVYSQIFVKDFSMADTDDSSTVDESRDVPSQQDLAIRGIHHFFLDMPRTLAHNFFVHLGMDDFHFFLKHHRNRPQSSPFRVFNGQQYKRIPDLADYFTFVNLPHEFDDLVQVQYGLCSGVTSLHRRFNTLAYFDPDNKLGQRIPNRRTHFLDWYRFYHDKIMRVARLKPTVIPGFQNLFEFSEGVFNVFLRKLVVNEWIINNLNTNGIYKFLQVNKTFSKKNADTLYEDLKLRLSLNYNPVVYLAAPGSMKSPSENWIHIVQVVSLSERRSNGSYNFQVIDINEYNPVAAIRDVVVQNIGIDSESMDDANAEIQALWVHDHYELSAAGVVPMDDREVAKIVENKLLWCTQDPIMSQLCLHGQLPSEPLNINEQRRFRKFQYPL